MLKFIVAGAVLAFGAAASNAPAFAAPRNQDCVDCPISNKYDSEEVVEKIKKIKRSLANEEPIDVRAGRNDYETGRISEGQRGLHGKRVVRPRHQECADCAPPRQYDSQEVVRKVRNVDRSRVINTRTVVPVYTRVKQTNHLVIHKDVIRNTGAIEHNNVIVEKETRIIRRIPLRTTVVFVTHHYRVVERSDSAVAPVTIGPRRGRDCDRGRGYGRYGSCRSLIRVRG